MTLGQFCPRSGWRPWSRGARRAHCLRPLRVSLPRMGLRQPCGHKRRLVHVSGSNGVRFDAFCGILWARTVFLPSSDRESRHESLAPHRSLCGPAALACSRALPSDLGRVIPPLEFTLNPAVGARDRGLPLAVPCDWMPGAHDVYATRAPLHPDWRSHGATHDRSPCSPNRPKACTADGTSLKLDTSEAGRSECA